MNVIKSSEITLDTNLTGEGIPAEILDELAEMQKMYAQIYRRYGVAGLGSQHIQLMSDEFVKTFKEYQTEERTGGTYKEKLFTIHNDVEFMAVR